MRPTRLILSPDRTQFFKHDSVSLSCSSEDSGPWFVVRNTSRETRRRCEVWGEEVGSTCVLDGLSFKDSGVYWCERDKHRSEPVSITVTGTFISTAPPPPAPAPAPSMFSTTPLSPSPSPPPPSLSSSSVLLVPLVIPVLVLVLVLLLLLLLWCRRCRHKDSEECDESSLYSTVCYTCTTISPSRDAAFRTEERILGLEHTRTASELRVRTNRVLPNPSPKL